MLIAAGQTPAGSGDSWKVIVPLIAAGIAFTAVMIKLWWDARSARRERLRELYAGGWPRSRPTGDGFRGPPAQYRGPRW